MAHLTISIVRSYYHLPTVHVSLVFGRGFPTSPSCPEDVSLDGLPHLVVDQDDEGEGEGREPPEEVDVLQLQHGVDARSVAKEDGQESLEDESEVELPVPHPLLEQGVPPGLADQQVGPLDDHDGHKESGLTGGLQLLPGSVSPLLAVGILEVVDLLRIPEYSEAEESAWHEAVHCHDHEVGEEAGRGLLVGQGDGGPMSMQRIVIMPRGRGMFRVINIRT